MQMSTPSNTTTNSHAQPVSIIGWIESEKASLAAAGLWISKRNIMDRLLARSLELKTTFDELSDGMEPMQWRAYLDVVLFTAAFWNPDETQKMRDARRRLEEINDQIASRSKELATLLGERSTLCNDYSFNADNAYHVCDLIDRASGENGIYSLHLKPELDKLRSQYDLKYWPKPQDVVNEIGLDAEDSKVEAVMEITQKAIGSRKASLRDFVRAFFEAIDEQRGDTFRDIPRGFNLTDESMAALFCCALDLSDDNLIDASYIKGVRQTERKRETR